MPLTSVRNLAFAASMMAFCGCGDDRQELPVGTMAVDGDRIAVHGNCHDGRRLDVTESATEIELTLSAERANGGDCFDCVVIRLKEPVGERDVVDSRTGKAVTRDGDPTLHDCFDS